MRHLIVPESPDYKLIYVDYMAQEIAIAASLSGDAAMREMYQANNAHMWFAIKAGTAPPGTTKATHKTIRNQYKRISLGVLYGLTAEGAAGQIGCSVAEATRYLDQHRRFSRVIGAGRATGSRPPTSGGMFRRAWTGAAGCRPIPSTGLGRTGPCKAPVRISCA